MSARIAISIGEDYPHLFASDDASEVAYYAGTETGYGVVIELTDAEWEEYTQAADRYADLTRKLYERYKQAGGTR